MRATLHCLVPAPYYRSKICVPKNRPISTPASKTRHSVISSDDLTARRKMPEVLFKLAIDGVPNDVRPGDPRVGSALAVAPVPDGRGGVWSVQQALASAAQTGHRTISDMDYQCLATDLQVGMKPLTAPRTIWLPDVDTCPFQDLVIADESGACSEALPITILPGPGTGDAIGTSEGTAILTRPYEGAWFRRGAANLWIRR